MIQTIEPDERGRAPLLKYLHMVGWEYGQGVEIDFIRPVEIRRGGRIEK